MNLLYLVQIGRSQSALTRMRAFDVWAFCAWPGDVSEMQESIMDQVADAAAHLSGVLVKKVKLSWLSAARRFNPSIVWADT